MPLIGNSITRVLRADRIDRVLTWQAPPIKSTNKYFSEGYQAETVSLQISSWVSFPNAPASHLPRMKLTWGHGSATHQIVCDLPGYASLSLVASNIQLQVWSEVDDTITPTAQTLDSPLYHISAVAGPGSVRPTKLTYTTNPHSAAAAFNENIPPGASEVWTVFTDNVTDRFAPSLPPGYLLLRAEQAGIAVPGNPMKQQRFDINEILNRPQSIWPQIRVGPATFTGGFGYAINNLLARYVPEVANVANTEIFRIVYGIEV